MSALGQKQTLRWEATHLRRLRAPAASTKR